MLIWKDPTLESLDQRLISLSLGKLKCHSSENNYFHLSIFHSLVPIKPNGDSQERVKIEPSMEGHQADSFCWKNGGSRHLLLGAGTTLEGCWGNSCWVTSGKVFTENQLRRFFKLWAYWQWGTFKAIWSHIFISNSISSIHKHFIEGICRTPPHYESSIKIFTTSKCQYEIMRT